MEGDTLIGLMMVGCVLGAMASNVLTLNAHGNTSYSVSLTTVATLPLPLVVPVALQFTLAGADSLSSQALWRASDLLLTVVLPVTLGHLMIHTIPQLQIKARPFGSLFANLVILWVIAVVVGLNREWLARTQSSLIAALRVLNDLGYLTGYMGGRSLDLREPMQRTLTSEIGMQHSGLGATQLFSDRNGAATVAAALYTFGCRLTETMLAQYQSKRMTNEIQMTNVECVIVGRLFVRQGSDQGQSLCVLRNSSLGTPSFVIQQQQFQVTETLILDQR